MREHWSDWRLFWAAVLFLLCSALPWLWVGEVCILCQRGQAQGRAAVPDTPPEEEAVQAAAPAPAPSEKLAALTFDDGPRRSTTTVLLDGLSQRGVRATFFLIGENVDDNEDLVERMEEEGHQVGIHSATHKALAGLNDRDFYEEVGAFALRLESILGHGGFALRPPYGKVDAGVTCRAEAPIVLWSVDPEDWEDRDADVVTQRIVSCAADGDVILLHDIYPSSVEAALRSVDALMAEGFRFVTVDELFAERCIPLEPGRCYRRAVD